MDPIAPPAAAPLLVATELCFARGAHAVLDRLSFAIGPGLTLVRGGDGRGKTTLLRLMAGELEPGSGAVAAPAGPPHRPDPLDPAHEASRARDWLVRECGGRPGRDPRLEARLVEGFALREHLDKELFRLSTGTRRKLALVAAFAAGAPLALLDAPFAALDRPSRGLLAGLLAEAASHRSRGWVIADHEHPPALEGVPLAGTIDLGD